MPDHSQKIYRIDVRSSLPMREDVLQAQLPAIGLSPELRIRISDIYFLEGALQVPDIDRIAGTLVSDPVTDHYQWRKITGNGVSSLNAMSGVIEVAFRPGVTDNTAHELLNAAHRLGITCLEAVSTATRYEVSNGPLSDQELTHLAHSMLVNDTIQHFTLGEIQPEFIHPSSGTKPPLTVDLRQLDDAALQALSAERRLALDLNEMRAIRDYFGGCGRPASDAELETIAQTWSEHCVHKTFKARIEVSREGAGGVQTTTLDGLMRTYLRAATEQINAPWVRSAFVDNAGIIAFDDDYDLSFKAETHNHPSAIEPFGGANTGIGGVVRDILGVSHRPIANTDALCFGPADLPWDALPEGVLHPARIRAGVIAGIEDYGNKLGIPTVNGAIFYHLGYTTNPLVYCGSVGIGPRDSHPRHPHPGDRVIVLGGRTGRDGLRGATFSSLTMDVQTGQVAGASVQIGDPIAKKGLLEVVELARDARLYSAITDCGAGGLSSAVGEMGEMVGACVDLATVPLKYAGLEPWEIWLSEAQERMVLAVPPENLPALREICETYWVEMSDIGEFGTDGVRLVVTHDETPVVDLEMGFLHACPRLALKAVVRDRESGDQGMGGRAVQGTLHVALDTLLLSLLSHPNIASKEDTIRVYDHEVRGATVVDPLVGLHADGPSDAAVLKPLETQGWRGFTLANGLNPLIGEADPYAMAVSAVDEAVRNAVAVGSDPDRTAILDNFCWGNPRRPETLGSLVEAARGCHDAALHYRTPFISGKDSLNNEYLGPDGRRHAIPGTLLISSIGIHPDVRNAVTMDLKAAGDKIYLLGEWTPALAGAHARLFAGADVFGEDPSLRRAPTLPAAAPQVYAALHAAIHQGLVRAAHDLSEGGLAVAAAEMALAGRLGLDLDIDGLYDHDAVALFAETNGCLLVEVGPDQAPELEMAFAVLPFRCLGEVTEIQVVSFHRGEAPVMQVPVQDCVEAFKAHL